MSTLARRFLLALTLVAPVLVAAAVTSASPASARCAPTESFTVQGKTAGWGRTDSYSEWIAGPATITRTISKETTNEWGGSASLTISLGAILAKAETTFSVNYSHSTSTSESFSYQVSIPSGKTGRMMRLHRMDRITLLQTLKGEDCIVRKSTQYAYLPLASTGVSTYCTIRDLMPAMGLWQSGCTNSD